MPLKQLWAGALPALWLIAAGCGSRQDAGLRLDSRFTEMIPENTIVLAGVRMEELRAAPVYRKLMAGRQFPNVDEFAARTGFDPRKDVKEMLIAATGEAVVALARGNFKSTRIDGMEQSSYKGQTLYRREGAALAILSPDTAVAGTEAGVKLALDRQNGGGRLLRMAQALPAASEGWIAGAGFAELAAQALTSEGNIANLRKVLASLESATFAADLHTGIDARAACECRTDSGCEAIVNTLRGVIALGRLSAPEGDREMLRIYDSVTVERTGRNVNLSLALPADLVDRVLKLMESD
ncbi:MAG: hypothetical protein WD696_20365 [Bryobacteraceae bacterium]